MTADGARTARSEQPVDEHILQLSRHDAEAFAEGFTIRLDPPLA